MARIEWNGEQLCKAAIHAAKQVAMIDAEIIKGPAVNNCPYDTSQTRESATVNEIEKGAEISFNTPQALWLHENENYKPQHDGTGPNYLRQPLLDKEQDYYDHVAEAVKAVFG